MDTLEIFLTEKHDCLMDEVFFGGNGFKNVRRLFGFKNVRRLFEAERLLTFSAFRMGDYSRWELIRGWALIRINTVVA